MLGNAGGVMPADCFSKQLPNLCAFTRGEHVCALGAHTHLHANDNLLHSYSGSLEGSYLSQKVKNSENSLEFEYLYAVGFTAH